MKNVKISGAKSSFTVDKLAHLGYQIDGNGISPCADRVDAFLRTPLPSSAAELNSFICCLQYYSKFVPHFATIAEPLYQLIAATEFKWSQVHQVAYDRLLSLMRENVVLGSFSTKVQSQVIAKIEQS